MSGARLYDLAAFAWMALSLLSFISLQFQVAPYGRYLRAGSGPRIPSVVGWMLMESPAVFMPLLALAAAERVEPAAAALTAMWLLHYVHRTFVWPLRMRLRGKEMPLFIAGLAFGTNVLIDGLVFFSLHAAPKGADWLSRPQFWVGALLFFGGLALNLHSDEILRRLRAPGETGYKIPYGGAFRWVSCPNYLGELIEWAGFALAASSWPALAFWAWCLSNLVPRARAHHRWYTETFPDYPPERRALWPRIG